MRSKKEIEKARVDVMIKLLEGRAFLDPLALVDLRARYQIISWVLKHESGRLRLRAA